MDWLTWISNMTATLAWPGVAALVVLRHGELLGQALERLITGTRRFSGFGVELEMFENQTHELASRIQPAPVSGASAAPSTPSPAMVDRPSTRLRLDEVAEPPAPKPRPPAAGNNAIYLPQASDALLRSPAFAAALAAVGQAPEKAIDLAWQAVEDPLRLLAAARPGSARSATGGISALLIQVMETGALAPSELGFILDLFDLHQSRPARPRKQPTASTALDFIRCAAAASALLERAAKASA